MAFDPSTAKPVKSKFDPTTARPITAGEGPPVPAQQTSDPASRLPPSLQGKGIEGIEGTPVMAAVNDFAKRFNMNITEALDALGPGLVNNILITAGSDSRVPTLTEGLEAMSNPNAATLPEGTLKNVVENAATGTQMVIGGIPVAGRNIASAKGVAAEFGGFGSAAPVAPTAGVVDKITGAAADRKALPHLIRETGDVSTAGRKLKPAPPPAVGQAPGIPTVVADKAAKQAMKHGFSDAMVAWVKSSTPASRQQMLRMVKILKGGHQNLKNRTVTPWHVMGDSIVSRYKTVLAKNQQAGKDIKKVAGTLRGKYRADPEPAMRNFYKELQEAGVSIEADKDGMLIPNFMDSDFMEVPGAESILKRLIKRLQISKRPDGRDLHALKQTMDEWVDYGGPQGQGLKGRAETVVKNLRRGIDKALDDAYPEYNEVNTVYADTVDALNKLRDVAGIKGRLGAEGATEVVGKVSGRMASKAVSGVDLRDAVGALEDVARKYNLELPGDEPREMVEFINELERIVRPGYSGDFSSKVGASIAREGAHMGLTGDATSTAGRILNWGIDKVAGVDETKALDAIEDLLTR